MINPRCNGYDAGKRDAKRGDKPRYTADKLPKTEAGKAYAFGYIEGYAETLRTLNRVAR